MLQLIGTFCGPADRATSVAICRCQTGLITSIEMSRRSLILGVVLSISIALRVEAHSVVDPGVYCQQLVSFFDYYGASRTENSDGRRNHARIGAEIDCKEGEHREGIAAMTDLLERKRFTVLPPSTSLLQLPYPWRRGQ